MNLEARIFENLTLDESHRRACKTLEEEAIKPEQFEDLYGPQGIKRDERYVAIMEKKFQEPTDTKQEELNKLATIFEAIIHINAELNEWFGPDATTIKTSRYDDIKNGVDSVAEFRENEASASYLALAIDVTFDHDTERKFERIKSEIKKGELAKIKYFYSEHMGIRGELTKVPRVVIGADIQTVKNLSELWMEKNNKALMRHQIQFQILEEILLQLETFAEFVKNNKQPEIAAVYEKTLSVVERIYEEKKKTIKDSGERDDVFYTIKSTLDGFNRTSKES